MMDSRDTPTLDADTSVRLDSAPRRKKNFGIPRFAYLSHHLRNTRQPDRQRIQSLVEEVVFAACGMPIHTFLLKLRIARGLVLPLHA